MRLIAVLAVGAAATLSASCAFAQAPSPVSSMAPMGGDRSSAGWTAERMANAKPGEQLEINAATIDALKAFPIVNAAHDGDNVVFRGNINLGIAVALDRGLLVPVIGDADDLSMLGLSKRIADLSERARAKKLMPQELDGLTFSITNPGIFGSQWGTPIIPQPSVAILGVGTIEKRVKVITLPDGTDTFAAKLCGYLTLGFDHRVIDGAVADQFMGHIKQTLETFDDAAM